MRKVNLTLIYLCVCISISFTSFGADGKVVSWVGPRTGGEWGNPSNWDTSSVPTAIDDVYLYLPNHNLSAELNISLASSSFAVGRLFLGAFNETTAALNATVGLLGPGQLTINEFYCGNGGLFNGLNVTTLSRFASLGRGRYGWCLLDDNTSLTTNGYSNIEAYLWLGLNDVIITNKGTFNINGDGLWPVDPNHEGPTSNQFINEGILLLEQVGTYSFTYLYTNLVNSVGGVANISVSTTVSGLFSNSGNVTVTGALTIGQFGYVQTRGVTTITRSITVGSNITILDGSVIFPTNPKSPFGINVVGNLFVQGGDLTVIANGGPLSVMGSLHIADKVKTKLSYFFGDYRGIFVSPDDFNKPLSGMICDLQGSLSMEVIFSQGFAPFLQYESAIMCSYSYKTNMSQIHVAFNDIALTQPPIGTVYLNTSVSQVGFRTGYNITIQVIDSYVLGSQANYKLFTSISENMVAMPYVNIRLSLADTRGGASLLITETTTNYLGMTWAYVQLPLDNTEDVYFQLVATIEECMNSNSSTCSVVATGSRAGNGGDGNWLSDHWWIIVAAAGATAIAGTVSAVTLFVLYRRQHRYRTYTPVQ